MEAVEDLSSKWRAFSLRLGLILPVLDKIQQDHRDVDNCLTEALGEWLKQNYDHQRRGTPSWRRLAEAARKLDYIVYTQIVKDHSITEW